MRIKHKVSTEISEFQVGFEPRGILPKYLGSGCAALGLTPWPYLRMRQTKTDPLGKNL